MGHSDNYYWGVRPSVRPFNASLPPHTHSLFLLRLLQHPFHILPPPLSKHYNPHPPTLGDYDKRFSIFIIISILMQNTHDADKLAGEVEERERVRETVGDRIRGRGQFNSYVKLSRTKLLKGGRWRGSKSLLVNMSLPLPFPLHPRLTSLLAATTKLSPATLWWARLFFFFFYLFNFRGWGRDRLFFGVAQLEGYYFMEYPLSICWHKSTLLFT